MRKILPLLCLLSLTACGDSEPPPQVSRIQPAAGADMSSLNYRDYRAYVSQRAQAGDGWASDIMSREYGESSAALQKKFMALDRDGNGRLSNAELSP